MKDNIHPTGTFAAVYFDEQTISKLQKFIKDNNIPNGVASNKMHCTLLYSKQHLPNFQPMGVISPPFKGIPLSLKKWLSRPDDDGNITTCLVLIFDCKKLVERHNHLMLVHDAIFNFALYTPHITLSYNVGSIQINNFSDITQTVDELVINHEHGVDLNLNWAKTSAIP